MNHFTLLLVCVLSVEIFARFNFLFYLDSIFKVTKKITYTLPNKRISDHWKGMVITIYAIKIMKFSMQILLFLFWIISLFLVADLFLEDFLLFLFSLIGLIESFVFAFVYIYLRKLVTE